MSDEGQQVCYMNSTFFDLVVLSLFRISLAFYPYLTTVCSYLLCSEYTDLAQNNMKERVFSYTNPNPCAIKVYRSLVIAV